MGGKATGVANPKRGVSEIKRSLFVILLSTIVVFASVAVSYCEYAVVQLTDNSPDNAEDGSQKWSFPAWIDGSSPNIASDGTIYIGSRDHNLYAISGSSGGVAESPWPMFQANPRHTGRHEPVPPMMDRLKPRRCYPEDEIKIIGYGFGETQEDSIVHVGKRRFDSSSARIRLWSNSKIKIRIPDYRCKSFKGQDYRKQKVWVTVHDVDTNKRGIKVIKPDRCQLVHNEPELSSQGHQWLCLSCSHICPLSHDLNPGQPKPFIKKDRLVALASLDRPTFQRSQVY